MKKTTLQLQNGNHILWPEHDSGSGRISRHEGGTVVNVEYDAKTDGLIAKVVCTREWFYSGVEAVHNIAEKVKANEKVNVG